MTDVSRRLDALVAELTRRGSPIATFLEPGLPKKEIRSRLAAAGAHAHPDVVSLYGWHNVNELGVSVVNGELYRSLRQVQLPAQVPRLLSHPSP